MKQKRLSRTKEEAIIRRRLGGEGVVEIGEAEGVAPTTVSKVVKRNVALIARLSEESEEQLSRIHAAALKAIEKDLGSRSRAVRQGAAVIGLKYITAPAKLQAAQEQGAGVNLAQVIQIYAEVVRGG